MSNLVISVIADIYTQVQSEKQVKDVIEKIEILIEFSDVLFF